VNKAATEPAAPALRRLLRTTAVIAVLLVLGIAVLAWLMQPPRAVGYLLDRIGTGLGLDLQVGKADYRLRGTPQLVLHDLVAKHPDDTVALLRAERVLVSLPWSTIRARGSDLTVERLELDGPVLDVPALQRWLATRPPSETRIPTLRNGLRVVRGRIVNHDWRIDGIDVSLPYLAPGAAVNARVRGRYVDPPVRMPFDLRVALTRPANDAGMAAIGGIDLEGNGWRLPARVRLSGPLHLGDDDVAISPARIGLSARYRSATSELPFALGAHGPLLFDEAVWSLDPASLVLRGDGPIPDAEARGALALGRRLVLRLQGAVAGWPDTWPALPPPLSASTSPMPFALDYAGRIGLDDVASLRLQRDATSFDARFRLPGVLAWLDAGTKGSPLPPLDGELRTPRVEVAGAQLEGVEVRIDDPAVAADPPRP
jgi:hypothetical protein